MRFFAPFREDRRLIQTRLPPDMVGSEGFEPTYSGSKHVVSLYASKVAPPIGIEPTSLDFQSEAELPARRRDKSKIVIETTVSKLNNMVIQLLILSSCFLNSITLFFRDWR